MSGIIVPSENLNYLKTLNNDIIDLIYIDPPFNTGKKQQRKLTKTIRDKNGKRKGFQGNSYSTEVISVSEFSDKFDDYIEFLRPRLIEAKRALKKNGSIFVHSDYREVHYVKVLLDEIFGRACFMNEIIWAYDYGARSKSRWSPKHDSILWYVMDDSDYTFNYDDMERIPYLAPGLAGVVKAARGKTPSDTWWHTIVSPTGKEKTGYPTQKPVGILDRIVKVHSYPDDLLLDFFSGSGSFGVAAEKNDRNYILVDNNEAAIKIMQSRLHKATVVDPELIALGIYSDFTT